MSYEPRIPRDSRLRRSLRRCSLGLLARRGSTREAATMQDEAAHEYGYRGGEATDSRAGSRRAEALGYDRSGHASNDDTRGADGSAQGSKPRAQSPRLMAQGSWLKAHGSRLIAISPPLLLAILIAKLWFTGTLGYYINSRTVPIVLAGGILFALVGIAGVLRRRSEVRLSWRTAAFLAPILVGLAVPARPLSAGTGQAATLGSLQLASHVSSGSPGDAFGSWISALGSHPDPQWWAGQKVSLVGFAMHQDGLPAHAVIIGRFLVTCCVVDATLLGFPAIISGKLPADGTWIQVNGTFARGFWTDPSGNQLPLIEHARASSVSTPASPYLSP